MEEKVSMEVAIQEIERWMDYKKIKAKKREASRAFIDIMVDAVASGNLIVEEDHKLKMILDFPIEGEGGGIKEITFLARITEINKDPYRRNIKTDTFEGQTMLTLCALTRQPINVIKHLDEGTDRSLAEAIALFFM